MKRVLYALSLLVLLVLGVAYAQDVGTVFGELLGTQWSALFVETSVYGALIGVVIKLINVIRPDTIVGPMKYYAAVALGVLGGVGADFAGVITAAAISDLPTPLAGVTFGFQAALVAVGLHQGVRQTSETFRTVSTTRLK